MTPCKLGAGGPCRGAAWILPSIILTASQIASNWRISPNESESGLPSPTILPPSDSAMEAKAQLTRATPPQFSCLATFAATTRKRRNSTFRNFGRSCCPWQIYTFNPQLKRLDPLGFIFGPRLLHPTMQKTKWYLRTPNRKSSWGTRYPVSISRLQLLHRGQVLRIKGMAFSQELLSDATHQGFRWHVGLAMERLHMSGFMMPDYEKTVVFLSIAWTTPAIGHPPVSRFNEGPTKAAFTSPRRNWCLGKGPGCIASVLPVQTGWKMKHVIFMKIRGYHMFQAR